MPFKKSSAERFEQSKKARKTRHRKFTYRKAAAESAAAQERFNESEVDVYEFAPTRPAGPALKVLVDDTASARPLTLDEIILGRLSDPRLLGVALSFVKCADKFVFAELSLELLALKHQLKGQRFVVVTRAPAKLPQAHLSLFKTNAFDILEVLKNVNITDE